MAQSRSADDEARQALVRSIYRRITVEDGSIQSVELTEEEKRHRISWRCPRLWNWRARRDSNSRPLGPQPNALSTELRAHAMPLQDRRDLAEREGFEPSKQVTPLGGLANRCTRPLCDLSVAVAAAMLPRHRPGL